MNRKVIEISPDHMNPTWFVRVKLESAGTMCRESRYDYAYYVKSRGPLNVGDRVKLHYVDVDVYAVKA